MNAWSKGNSVILADEMGLGKTIQTICFLKESFSLSFEIKTNYLKVMYDDKEDSQDSLVKKANFTLIDVRLGLILSYWKLQNFDNICLFFLT